MTPYNLDFETYSEAGLLYDLATGKWRSAMEGSKDRGLKLVGGWVYAQHASTDVLVAKFATPGGPIEEWKPGYENPHAFLEHVRAGGLISAQNSMFEYLIWNYVCVPKYGWPPVHYGQMRDTAALCRAHSIPGNLGAAAQAMGVTLKQEIGKRLINRYSMPCNTTKSRHSTRHWLHDNPEDSKAMDGYCEGDVVSETELAQVLPKLSDFELRVWLLSEKINTRGVHVDRDALAMLSKLVASTNVMYEQELARITGGRATTGGQTKVMADICAENGEPMASMDADHVEAKLKQENVHPLARRILELRQLLSLSSVSKLKALDAMTPADQRYHDGFVYCGADRTGRWAGRGVQLQNLPKDGPAMRRCDVTGGCGKHYGAEASVCPWCGTDAQFSDFPIKWNADAVEDVIEAANVWADLPELFAATIAEPLPAISGCIRGLLTAAPGKDLICSDYSAIEAVVLAELAGESWRQEVFRTHGKIYETGASRISGVPFEDFLTHKQETGEHHPLRNGLGKVSELASGFGGARGAWLQFGAGSFMSLDEIDAAVKLWRASSPAIVDFWYGVERAAIAAVRTPGTYHTYRGITYGSTGSVLYCQLPSGRKLTYHKPLILKVKKKWGTSDTLTYLGGRAMTRLETFGGKLTENIVQAVGRDLLAFAMLNVEAAGYPIVIHVHDEIIAEIPEGVGDVAHFEWVMSQVPDWAEGWPVRASGGWIGKRFRK